MSTTETASPAGLADSRSGKVRRRTLSIALAAAGGYYVGALAGQLLQALPNAPSSFWLPNALLLGLLLLTRQRNWWIYLLAVLPAHVLSHAPNGVPPAVMAVQYLSNTGQVLLSAWVMRRFVAPSGWFDRLRDTGLFILLAALAIPAVFAVLAAGAFVLVDYYPDFWGVQRIRLSSNVIAILTITPLVVLGFERVVRRRQRAYGTARLLECMRHRGVTRILFGSSSSVYGNDTPAPFSESAPADRPISPYAATKRAGELLVRSSAHLFGIDAICLRFFTVYGPRQRPDLAIHKFTGLMSRGSPIPVFGDGRSERDYTEIEDVLDGVEAALAYVRANPGTFEVVNLGSSRTISLRRMIDEIASALGVRVRTVHLGDQAGDVRRTFADVSKARRLLGYRPSVPFDAGIRRFVDWFLSQPTRARAAS